MKYISVCGGAAAGGGMPQDIAAEVASAMKAKSPMSFMKARQKRTLKRTNSCPDWHEIEEIVAAKNKPIAEEQSSKENTEETSKVQMEGKNDEENGFNESKAIISS